MNVNQILNMVIKLVMRKAINSGINAGIKGASKMGNRRKQSKGEVDDYGQPIGHEGRPQPGNKMSQEQVRQTRKAARVANRIGKM
ncbi:hypothetical protein [Pseudosulfitobacter koreensis]|uniref:Uncharacterized protein n=1 Tax=Pseudosulfitobacter koreensis TaxID=2968472 RepID=A0ABT1YXB8_9RHOB|nr:hypothetical protein [Pseudosulfitobacter koreense]MCR8825528.1 hypothetical protein [Pseudosulfitobacter koreense]